MLREIGLRSAWSSLRGHRKKSETYPDGLEGLRKRNFCCVRCAAQAREVQVPEDKGHCSDSNEEKFKGEEEDIPLTFRPFRSSCIRKELEFGEYRSVNIAIHRRETTIGEKVRKQGRRTKHIQIRGVTLDGTANIGICAYQRNCMSVASATIA
jgi:hypothetical protein